MKTRTGLLMAGLLALTISTPAWAIELFDTGVTAVGAGDPTQLGRLSRNAVPQDWTGGEPFPGVLNPSTTYHYRTFNVAITDAPYVQIDVDSVSGNTFASAYLDSYSPSDLAANWLGDAGSSGNAFGVNPLYFQVIVPVGHTLVLVMNNTGAANLGVGDPFDILVEGFTDTEYTDPVRGAGGVPEPGTWAMLMAGLFGVGAMSRRGRSLALRKAI